MKKQVIIDTDVGGDIDDAYALALALNSEELDIKAIITNDKYSRERAQVAKEILKAAKKEIPVFKGIEGGNGQLVEKKLIKNSNFEPPDIRDNLAFFKSLFVSKISYISLGSLSNLSYFIEHIPEITKQASFFIMGGSIKLDYKGREKLVAEWNIRNDLNASKNVFKSDADITLVPLDSTWDIELKEENLARIRDSGMELNQVLDKMWLSLKDYLKEKLNLEKNPILHDPLTVALAIDESFVSMAILKVSIDDEGKTIVAEREGKPVRVAISSDKGRFLKFFMGSLISR